MPGVTIKFTGQLDPGAWGYRAVLFNGPRRLGFTGLLYWYTPALYVILNMTTRGTRTTRRLGVAMRILLHVVLV